MKASQGSVLILSLVLLLVLTVVGVSTMSNMGMNEQMASNYRDHDLAFQAAEAALVAGEKFAADYAGTFDQDDFQSSCTGATCFTSACKEGRCFTGSYPPIGSTGGGGGGKGGGGNSGGGNSGSSGASTNGLCSISPPATPLWKATSTWSSSNGVKGYAEYPVTIQGISENPKYIVEFLCYTPADPDVPPSITPPPYGSEYAYMFRVTAYAKGTSDTSQVMLQSTYKVLQ